MTNIQTAYNDLQTAKAMRDTMSRLALVKLIELIEEDGDVKGYLPTAKDALKYQHFRNLDSW